MYVEGEDCVCVRVWWKERHQQAVNQAPTTACHSSIQLVRGRMGVPGTLSGEKEEEEEEVQEGRWRKQGGGDCLSQ